LNGADRMARHKAYVGSIVERDVAPVAEIRRPDTLRRLINQLAHRTAEELNVTTLWTALGARNETVTGHLDMLSRLGSVHRLATWTSSGPHKEVKSWFNAQSQGQAGHGLKTQAAARSEGGVAALISAGR
jgi:predicted AAA+ superfamily ATPase